MDGIIREGGVGRCLELADVDVNCDDGGCLSVASSLSANAFHMLMCTSPLFLV
jgi:hypothetical protein